MGDSFSSFWSPLKSYFFRQSSFPYEFFSFVFCNGTLQKIIWINLLNILLLWLDLGFCETVVQTCLHCSVPNRWRRKWQPTPVLLPGKSHGLRILVGYSPWHRKELDTTERFHFTSLHSCGTFTQRWLLLFFILTIKMCFGVNLPMRRLLTIELEYWNEE